LEELVRGSRLALEGTPRSASFFGRKPCNPGGIGRSGDSTAEPRAGGGRHRGRAPDAAVWPDNTWAYVSSRPKCGPFARATCRRGIGMVARPSPRTSKGFHTGWMISPGNEMMCAQRVTEMSGSRSLHCRDIHRSLRSARQYCRSAALALPQESTIQYGYRRRPFGVRTAP
jgi:hypothetical protein